MLIIQTVPEAIGLMLVGIVLLGTWPAVWHQVEQSGRLPSHIFMDYCLTYLVFAAACALTLGQLGPPTFSPLGQSLQFLDQLQQQNWQLVMFALAGGTCLALGDLALQYSIALCGLSIGPPILNSITVIVGVVLAYFLDGGINKPELVFTGAAFAAVAVGLGAAAHVVSQRTGAGACNSTSSSSSSTAGRHPVTEMQAAVQQRRQGVDHHQQQQQQQQAVCRPDDSAHGCAATCKQRVHDSSTSGDGLSGTDAVMLLGLNDAKSRDCEVGDLHSATAAVAPAAAATHPAVLETTCSQLVGRSGPLVCSTVPEDMLGEGGSHSPKQQQQQQRRSVTASRGSSMYLGLALTVLGGIIYGCFMPAFQISANDPFKLLPSPTPPLSVYTTFFYFAVSFTGVSGALNVWLMYQPPLGIQPSCLTAYLKDNKGRLLSVFSGVLAGLGDLTQFMGGQTAGYAAAMMVMAYPVVGVLWGLLRFKELRQKPAGQAVPWALVLILAQVVLYVLSVGLLSGSAELRSH